MPLYLYITNKNKHAEPGSKISPHDYCCENVSDDFMFKYDEENDIVVSAVYRRYGNGLMAF